MGDFQTLTILNSTPASRATLSPAEARLIAAFGRVDQEDQQFLCDLAERLAMRHAKKVADHRLNFQLIQGGAA